MGNKTIVIDIDNTIADYTGALRAYVRESGNTMPCPDPTAYDFSETPFWPFSGSHEDFRW